MNGKPIMTLVRHTSRPWTAQVALAARGFRAVGAAVNDDQRPPRCDAPIHTYGGACTTCGGQHLLSCTEEAAEKARQLLQTILEHDRLDYASPDADPRFALDMLFTKGPGRMIGVLVAVDQQGSTHVLKAFSGQIGETWYIPGWVGPVAGIINTSPVYVRTRRTIERMSARILQLNAAVGHNRQHRHKQQKQVHTSCEQTVTSGSPQGTNAISINSCARSQSEQQFLLEQQQLLKRRRKRLSHHLLKQIQQSYNTKDFSQQPIHLPDVYLQYVQQYEPQLPVTRTDQFTGMPAGAGDCCATKLLHAAVMSGLTPTGLCEVWCGSAPGTATKAKMGRPVPVDGLDASSTRLHAEMYGMCDKCKALLGTMLCGLN